MIRVLGAQRNPRKAWERLTESHPEVVAKCYNLQFPGPGQRDTPVAKTKEEAYYIMRLYQKRTTSEVVQKADNLQFPALNPR
jgi:hypothetical protein